MTAGAAALPTPAVTGGVVHSCLYVGEVRHRRFDAVKHAFSSRLYFVMLDLDELDAAFAGRWWWSAKRPAPMRWKRRDYFGDPTRPLADCVRDAVATATGNRPDGPVRVLTNLRSFGFVFNPVTFYWCHDRHGRLAAVLAEITNTPWGERHHYVVPAGPGDGPLRGSFEKRFHVSPFQPMEQRYDWTLTRPGEQLVVHMENVVAPPNGVAPNGAVGQPVFDATLRLQRRPWTTANLTRAWLRHPLMAVKVLLVIYWQALRLFCKRAPFHTHPDKRAS